MDRSLPHQRRGKIRLPVRLFRVKIAGEMVRLGTAAVLVISVAACRLGAEESQSRPGSAPPTPTERPRYPAPVEERILRECQANGGSEAVCRCTLAKLEARYSFGELLREAGELSRTGRPNDEVLAMIDQCRTEAQ